jgi:hypothetical protein
VPRTIRMGSPAEYASASEQSKASKQQSAKIKNINNSAYLVP